MKPDFSKLADPMLEHLTINCSSWAGEDQFIDTLYTACCEEGQRRYQERIGNPTTPTRIDLPLPRSLDERVTIELGVRVCAVAIAWGAAEAKRRCCPEHAELE